jgi:hypothetical protein
MVCADRSQRWDFSKVYIEFSMGIQVVECLLQDTVLAVHHTVWTAFETQHLALILGREVKTLKNSQITKFWCPPLKKKMDKFYFCFTNQGCPVSK